MENLTTRGQRMIGLLQVVQRKLAELHEPIESNLIGDAIVFIGEQEKLMSNLLKHIEDFRYKAGY